MKHALAVDIGGTFTDVVLIRSDGKGWTDKTLTTHHNLLEGFFRAADSALAQAGITLSQIDDVIVHATTVVTNVLIERKGPPVALVTTAGFADVLYIRDEHRYDMFDPLIEYAPPLIPREHTWSVEERTFADGSIGAEVKAEDIEALAVEFRKAGIEAVAVALLNSYANPANEQKVRDYLQAAAPDLLITLSSDVAPQMREYERSSTAAINAYAVPIITPYFNSLAEKLREGGATRDPFIMLSNGGVLGIRTAAKYPVRMIESGPAAGALVAGHIARRHGIDTMISFDMGGTTAKACLIQGGQPLVVGEFEVDRQYLFKPGSGMPVAVPSIDMIEIGAGGGSIARIDELGLLKVGPDSAGSNPGPACYDRGGAQACVTDADLVLGILDADNFLGGDMKLAIDKSRAAIQKLADGLGVSLEEAAYGIFSVVGESMASAARAHATDRGVNYRGLPMLAFGGAGPVHACYVAEQVGSSQVIYPPMASVLSAFGTLVTPVRLDIVRSSLMRLTAIDWAAVDAIAEAMIVEGRQATREAGVPDEATHFTLSADMRYLGQQNQVTVLFNEDPRDTCDVAALRAAFERDYETLYGVRLDDMDVEIVNWRVTAQGGTSERDVAVTLAETPGAPKKHRKVFIGDRYMDVPVFDRRALALSQEVAGPVIVEERETTAFILPGWTLSIDASGSLIASRN
ncbi:hydantoinase/oxoprolinase family protein [Sphingomonas flavalba]|uniref:hydantoinase/oxoprolinase family protein n=1 Tax=Sphingomonas flavalba TaxID=2559804 RepID=UPI0039DFE90F